MKETKSETNEYIHIILNFKRGRYFLLNILKLKIISNVLNYDIPIFCRLFIKRFFILFL